MPANQGWTLPLSLQPLWRVLRAHCSDPPVMSVMPSSSWCHYPAVLPLDTRHISRPNQCERACLQAQGAHHSLNTPQVGGRSGASWLGVSGANPVSGTDQSVKDASNASFFAIGLVERDDVSHVRRRVIVQTAILFSVAVQSLWFWLQHWFVS